VQLDERELVAHQVNAKVGVGTDMPLVEMGQMKGRRRAESIVEIIQSADYSTDALLDDLGAQTAMSAALPT